MYSFSLFVNTSHYLMDHLIIYFLKKRTQGWTNDQPVCRKNRSFVSISLFESTKSAKCNTLEWKAIVAPTRWLQKTHHILSCCAACPKNKRKRDKSRTKEEAADLEYKYSRWTYLKVRSLKHKNKSRRGLTQDLRDASGALVDPCTVVDGSTEAFMKPRQKVSQWETGWIVPNNTRTHRVRVFYKLHWYLWRMSG